MLKVDQVSKRFLIAFAVAALSGQLALGKTAAAARSPQRPNILVLLSDDHLYRALGCAGDKVIHTPNLDRLASSGVYFSHCFTPMPQCSPSRAALFTGQDCWTSGVRSGTMPFAKDAVLWPQVLADAGYQTYMTGKWHNATMPWDCGFECGANIYEGGMADHRHISVIQWHESKRDRTEASGFSTTVFADSVIKFLHERDSTKPFCAYVAFTAPHDPWVPPAEYADMYDPARMPLPPNYMAKVPFRAPDDFIKLRDQQVLPYPRTESDVKRGLALYYGMISQLDHEVGRILDAVDQLGLADNTLIIFAGDHGYSLGSHGFVGKQCMYEEGIRLPLIVRYPRLTKGPSQCDALVSLTDFYATLCAAAGAAVPDAVEGRSLLPLYQGKPVEWRDRVFASHHSPEKHSMSTQCVRTERYKLVQHRLTDETEFFDLKDDPFELVNLAGKPAVAAIESQLSDQLTKWGSTHVTAASDSADKE
jgi:arylsulfatase A-like enzyme